MSSKPAYPTRNLRCSALFLGILASSIGPSAMAQQTASLAVNVPVFLPAVTYSAAGSFSYSVAVGDFNGDGKPDLVVASCSPIGSCGGDIEGVVSIMLGNGDGTFGPPTKFGSGGVEGTSVAVADFNGDGKLDIVVTNRYYSADVGVLLGNGDGTFQAAVTYASGGDAPASVAIADVNGDGHPDLVVGNTSSCPGCTDAAWVGVLLGNGDGTFRPVTAYRTGGFANGGVVAVAAADVNGDGRVDIVVGNTCGDSACTTKGSIGVLLGNGDGSFRPAVTYGPIASGFSVLIADVNGDDKPDVLASDSGCTTTAVCTPSTVAVLLGNGDGSFQPPRDFGTGGYASPAIAVADVNGDGKPDLLVANGCAASGNGNCVNVPGTVAVLVGNGDGTFQSPTIYASGGTWISDNLVAADVNGDGKPDLLAVNLFGTDGFGSVAVLLNNTPIAPPLNPTTTALTGIQKYLSATYFATVANATGTALSGTVTFYDGNTVLGTGAIFGNQAVGFETFHHRQVGTIRTITATYSGDANNSPSTSPGLSEIVKAFTWIHLSTSLSPSFVGQQVTFHVSENAVGIYPTDNAITFSDNGKVLGVVPPSGGSWSFTTSFPEARQHSIRADFPGSPFYFPSYAVVTQRVEKYATTTIMRSGYNPSRGGQPVTFVVTVAGSGPSVPTGRVRFLDGTAWIGSGILNGGVATLTHKFARGTHPITALYRGDSAFAQSNSIVLNQVVQ